MRYLYLIFIVVMLPFGGCIKDDFIDDSMPPELRITSSIDTLAIGENFQMEAIYLNGVGQTQNVPITWSSSNPLIMSITSSGLAEGLQLGDVEVYAEHGSLIDTIKVAVGNKTVIMPVEKSGTIATTSTYALEGNFTLKESGDDLILEFFGDYKASQALPQLVVYLSNNAASNGGGAYEIATVTVFSGAHSYTIPNVGINDYKYVLYFCKPFAVKVGHGEIKD